MTQPRDPWSEPEGVPSDVAALLADARERAPAIIDESVERAQQMLHQPQQQMLDRIRRSVNDLTADMRALHSRLDGIEALLRSSGVGQAGQVLRPPAAQYGPQSYPPPPPPPPAPAETPRYENPRYEAPRYEAAPYQPEPSPATEYQAPEYMRPHPAPQPPVQPLASAIPPQAPPQPAPPLPAATPPPAPAPQTAPPQPAPADLGSPAPPPVPPAPAASAAPSPPPAPEPRPAPEPAPPPPAGESVLAPEDGSVSLRISPVAGFQGLMRVQDALARVRGIRGAGVEAYAQGEARLRLQLADRVEPQQIATSLSELLGRPTLVASVSIPERMLHLALE